MDFRIRKATPDDEQTLLEWANDSETRKNAFNIAPISAESHRNWLSDCLANEDGCQLYIAELRGTSVGQVRFDRGSNDSWAIDYSLDAKSRGRNLGVHLLRCAIDEFLKSNSNITLLGKVKCSNPASCKVFEKLHFEKIHLSGKKHFVFRRTFGVNSPPLILLASPHRRNDHLMAELTFALPEFVIDRVRSKRELKYENLKEKAPKYIFFLHWSWLIESVIYENFECVVFHMTDLPFGRGGSPLQNLIVRGFTETKLSALQCVAELDAGPVYLKNSLGLEGTAEEILQRASSVMGGMILEIVKNELTPVPQSGDPVFFKRRTPEESSVSHVQSLNEFYDHVRMLDAEGYPPAFLDIGKFRMFFSDAKLNDDGLTMSVKIESSDND